MRRKKIRLLVGFFGGIAAVALALSGQGSLRWMSIVVAVVCFAAVAEAAWKLSC
jgi:hypothetical protein